MTRSRSRKVKLYNFIDLVVSAEVGGGELIVELRGQKEVTCVSGICIISSHEFIIPRSTAVADRGRGGSRDATPLSVHIFFLFSCSFRPKFCQI